MAELIAAKIFKDRVLLALYQDEKNSSDEEIEKQSLEKSKKLKKELKRKDLEQNKDTRTESRNWPVPLPKLKKVYTVAVRREDLQKTADSKAQGSATTTSSASTSCSGSSYDRTQDAAESSKKEQKISKNKKRKLKKKRQMEKERKNRCQPPFSREFTY